MAEGVNDGFVSVAVSVGVKVGVTVTLAVGVEVDVGVGVEVSVDAVIVGVRVGGGMTGLGKNTSAAMARRMIATINGMTTLRNAGGRKVFALSKGVTTGGSPVCPSAERRFLKLSAYSPIRKLV